MEKIELKDAFAEFKNQKNIDRPTMMGVLEDVFRTQITKTYGSADNFDIIINIDKGDCEIYWNREVVEEVEDPNTEIAQDDPALDDDYEIGETFAKKIELKDFGRRGILNIRQNLQGRIMDIEKANLYNKYVNILTKSSFSLLDKYSTLYTVTSFILFSFFSTIFFIIIFISLNAFPR